MLPDKLCFVDIETSGSRVTYDRVIEIGILRVENNKIVDTFQSLINPQIYVSPFIESLTGITKNDLENAPTFYEVKDKIVELLKDSIFVAHNVRFDYGFLKNEFKRYDFSFTAKHFCTVKLSQLLFPQQLHHNLDSIIERFSLQIERRHRAFDDAKILWDFYQSVQKMFPLEKIAEAVNISLKKPSIPLMITKANLDSLPESPGVYIFYGDSTIPLYIGKSVNIRDRVLSHFTSDHMSSKEMEMCQEIRRIETQTTAGELSALFKESFLIKQEQPLYNRQLRHSMKLIVALKSEDKDGFSSLELQEVEKISPDMMDQVLGIFRSRKKAKEFFVEIVKLHGLCEKKLGLQTTGNACFAYHLGWCKGACAGKEEASKYNLRFILAFSKYRIKPWPFPGPILIHEENILEEKVEGTLVDKWCFLGNITQQKGEEHVTYENNAIFDKDIYKILLKFINNKKNWKKIKTITSYDLSHFHIPLSIK